MNKPSLLALMATFGACASQHPVASGEHLVQRWGTDKVTADNVGRQVRIRGWAVDRKGGAVLVTADGTHVWIDGVDYWPSGYYRGGDTGKRLRVSGTLDEDHGLPVFVQKKGEIPMQGMAVPEGTDLDEASHRFVLRDATW